MYCPWLCSRSPPVDAGAPVNHPATGFQGVTPAQWLRKCGWTPCCRDSELVAGTPRADAAPLHWCVCLPHAAAGAGVLGALLAGLIARDCGDQEA